MHAPDSPRKRAKEGHYRSRSELIKAGIHLAARGRTGSGVVIA
jgi:Arc/MetJ-type ribon-helix-helix transcriptional regulator